MSVAPIPIDPERLLAFAQAVLSAVISAGLLVAAVLVPAPAGALPVVVATCVGLPLAAGAQLRTTAAGRHEALAARRALAELRRGLAALREAEHPLGL